MTSPALLAALLAGSLVLSLSGCGSSDAATSDEDSTLGFHSAALKPLGDCADLQASIRAAAYSAAMKNLDASLAAARRSPGGQCRWEESDMGASQASANGGAAPPASGSSSGGATEVSTTNNQLAGVDEADFIKNDNEFLYVVSGDTFRIIDAWPAEEAHPVASVKVPGTATKLFVEADRAVVFSSIGASQGGECTYGYECVPRANGTTTAVSVFDISDRTAPKLLRTVNHSGSLLGARRIGTMIHAVVATRPVPFVSDTSLDTCGRTTQQVEGEYLRRKAAIAKDVAELDLAKHLPTLQDSVAPDQTNQLCSGLYASALADGQAFTSIISFDALSAAPATMSTVLSSPGVVMGSSDALYVAVPHVRNDLYGWFLGMEDARDATDIHKFSVGKTPSDTHYTASGVVKGRVLNQFALDEHQGHLRVATTTDHAPSPGAHSTMTVLATQGSTLERVGAVDHIAPSEDIRSVRFDGARAFIVTFKKTDPLYAFDLSQPGAPRITGELKIPGFSTYMHMMDETHLLTIGYDAVDHGDFAYFDGVLFQIFDVSNPSQPTQAFSHKIGTRGSSSEALTNHLAFNYFAPKNILAVPMTICEGGGDGLYGHKMTFSGLKVLDVTATGGFSEHGQVSHPASANASCDNWWTNATSEVRRSVIMDDYVFSVSNSRVKVNRLDNLGEDLVDIGLAPAN